MEVGSIEGSLPARGRVAQLGERLVRNEEVAGSIPVSSTNLFSNLARFRKLQEVPKVPIWHLHSESSSNSVT
jgi:hypothetical protein